MKKSICLCTVVFLFFSCNKLPDFIPLPSTPAPQFSKAYGGSVGDIANGIVSSLDGGYVMAGWTRSNDGDVTGNHGQEDAWVLKLDKSGNKLWQKALGGTGRDYASSIAASWDGGYIIAGYTSSNDGDVSGNHGGYDAWVIKLDKDGNKQWQKTFGGNDYDQGNSITATLDGGYVMAAYTSSTDGDVSSYRGRGDVWVVKLDKHGNKQWQKTLGGTGEEFPFCIKKSTAGGYVIAAYTQSNDGDVSGNHGGFGDAWVVHLDKSGNTMWQKTLGGSERDYANSITPSVDGGYVLAGETNSNDGDVSGYHGGGELGGDAWVVKLDKDGNKQWQKALGGSGYDKGYAVIPSGDGGYIMAGESGSDDGDVSGLHGSFYGDAWVVKLDKHGNKQWQKALGGTSEDGARSIIPDFYGGYVIAGVTGSDDGDINDNHSPGLGDAWVITIKNP